jgi:MFS transporter, PPP family, 3-phenylpropionic acid transporter
MPRIRLLYLLHGFAVAAFGPFASVILADRGFEPAAIGLVYAVTSLVYIVSVPAWGHLGDVVLGRARALRLAMLGAAAMLLVFALPLALPLLALAYVGYAACYGAAGPLSDALAVNALRDPARQYGQVRALLSASFTVTAVGFGVLYGIAGYWPAPFLFVGFALVIAWLSGSIPDLKRATLAVQRRGGAIREALALQPALVRVLLAVGIAHVGVFAGFSFLSLRIVELGGGPPQVALSSAVAAAAEVVALVAAGRIVRRVGMRTMFAGASLLSAIAFASWVVLTSPEAIVASRLLSGAGFAGIFIASVTSMQLLLPPRLQGSGQALASMTTAGIAAFVANVLGGLIYGGPGHQALFGVGAAFAVAGALLGWLWLPRRGARRFTEPGPAQPVAAGA